MRFSELAHESTSLLFGYPNFVRGDANSLARGEIPVFVFHTIVPERFEAQLQYLVENGYRTLSLDEFLASMRGTRKMRGKEVLLTIDDARSSVWIYGYPLLRKHHCVAALFAIPGWTPAGPCRPNLDDAGKGAVQPEELARLDPEDAQVCTWEELRVMHSSGHVAVDSHSHLHRRVFTDDRLQGYVEQALQWNPSDAAFSPYLSLQRSPLQYSKEYFHAWPLFTTRSLLEDGPAWTPDEDFVAAAREIAASAVSNGLPRSEVLRRLQRIDGVRRGADMPAEALERSMEAELSQACDLLRKELHDASRGRSLCLPYSRGGSTVIRVSKRLGIEAVFWGVRRERRANFVSDDLFGVVRLKGDFLWRLPGKGRRSIAKVYSDKALARIRGEAPY